MNKQIKNLIRAGIVLLAVIALTVAAVFIIPLVSEEEESSSITDDSVTIYSFDSAFIERMQVINPISGDDYVIVKGRKAGTTVYNIEGDDVFPYRQTYFTLNLSMLAELSAGKVIQKDVEDLSQFGITDKSGKVIASLTDGRTVEVTFGSQYPLDSLYYYATVDDTKTVYTIRSSIYESLCSAYTEYRDLYLFPSLTDDTYENLDTFSYQLRSGYRVTVHREDGVYYITEPIQGESDSYNISEKFLSKLNDFSPLAVIEDYPDDLAVYGLDQPIRLEYKLVDGTETTMLIGGVTDDYAFVMKEGLPMVFAATGDLSFLDETAEDLLDTGLFMYSIKNVTKVTYYDGEQTRVLEIDDQIDDETGEGTFSAKYQGEEISEGNTRSMYTGFLSFYSIDSYSGEVPTETQYKVVFDMRDGTQNTMELRRINSRKYAAVINGECHSYVSVTAVQDLTELITRYENGEDISNLIY